VPASVSQTPTHVALTAIVPTLESDKVYDVLKNLIQGSADCKLPCWGGINPGISSNTEAETIVQPLFVLVYDREHILPPYIYKGKEFSGPGGGRNFVFGDTQISFGFGWLSEQGKDLVEISRISADTHKILKDGSGETVYGDKAYNQLFEEYSLHKILSTYGAPTRVLTFAQVYNDLNNRPDPNPEDFQLLLLYDKGIFIEYKMPIKRIGNNKGEACPSQALFDIRLVPAEASKFYEEMWSAFTTGTPDFSYRMPVEKSTQMTFDQFYQAFSKSNDPCFEVRLDIWPQH
jgi:hypothetical protein